MKELRGKLRRSSRYDFRKGNFQPTIMDMITEAENQLEKIKDMKELRNWKKEWFGEKK